MDLLVTTPQSESENARREAEHLITNGGGYYFRCFFAHPRVEVGDKVFYVERGYIRGYAIIDHTKVVERPTLCSTTNREWKAGFYIYMRADSWKWIRPIPRKGFMGFRYLDRAFEYEVVGSWLDPMPTGTCV